MSDTLEKVEDGLRRFFVGHAATHVGLEGGISAPVTGGTIALPAHLAHVAIAAGFPEVDDDHPVPPEAVATVPAPSPAGKAPTAGIVHRIPAPVVNASGVVTHVPALVTDAEGRVVGVAVVPAAPAVPEEIPVVDEASAEITADVVAGVVTPRARGRRTADTEPAPPPPAAPEPAPSA